MTVLSFQDPGNPRYEIYAGPLGQAFYVRLEGHLVGVARDPGHALSIMASDKARRRRFSRENPTMYMAA